jgi:hypothetical protein
LALAAPEGSPRNGLALHLFAFATFPFGLDCHLGFAVGRRTLLAAAVAAVGSELLAVPEVVERPRLITVAAVVVVLLIALALGAEGGDSGVGGLVVEHGASGWVVGELGEWREDFATGLSFETGPGGSLLAQAPAHTARVAQRALAPWPSAPHGCFGGVAGVALATLTRAS